MENGNAKLYEYKSKTSKKCLHTIKIASIENLRAKGKRKFAFSYCKKEIELEAENAELRDKWVDILEKNIKAELGETKVKKEEEIILLDI